MDDYISQETKEKLEELIQSMFILNRIWDRGLSVLNVQFAMNNFEKIYHVGLAHKFPILADFFSDILSSYNLTTKYLSIPMDDSNYNTPLEFFNINYERHREAYLLLKDAIKTSIEQGDINVEVELKKFMIIFNKYISQAILLQDKSQLYNTDYAGFDNHCDKFYLFGD